MKLIFKQQPYQTDATMAVVRCFEGQSKGFRKEDISRTGLFTEKIFSNKKLDTDIDIFKNVQVLQKEQGLKTISSLDGLNFTIEMETGTGKTYVYTKTMYELNKHYGWNKFIIMVPSVAIREGVNKSLEITAEHFQEIYGKKIRFSIYNTQNKSNLINIKSFADTANIEVIIMNYQAFATTSKESRKIYQKLDSLQSEKPINIIKRARPILIIDEPQRFGEKAEKIFTAREFNQLFTLRYSATHKKEFNKIYRLDAIDAYNQKLVKKISVKGIEVVGNSGTNSYLFLDRIQISTNKYPVAYLELEVKQSNGIQKKIRQVKEKDDLFVLSNELKQYKGFVVKAINGLTNKVSFTNGVKLTVGQTTGDVDEEHVRRIQIRETVKSHIEKERMMFSKGIKVLSLFFIDEVAKYRLYDKSNNQQKGDYAKIFEEEYKQAISQLNLFEKEYNGYLHRFAVDEIHKGYFSIDKKGRLINSKENKNEGGISNDVSAYDLIMKNKEKLLSLNEPTRFIFSHSALREGWDNPNVFQICTLKHSQSEISKRQEIGRGLRICVNSHGERMDTSVLENEFFDINKLTVVASESYDSFAKALQNEIVATLSERPVKLTIDVLNNRVLKNEKGEKFTFDNQSSMDLIFDMKIKGYIDNNYQITDVLIKAIESKTYEVPGKLKGFESCVAELIQNIYTTANFTAAENESDNNIDEPVLKPNDNFAKKEFQDLWKKIKVKTVYEVDFASQELIVKCIIAIDNNLTVKKIFISITSGQQQDKIDEASLKAGESMIKEKSITERAASLLGSLKYDLVAEIAKETNLTRKTIVKILQGLRQNTFYNFRVNPESFIQGVARIINSEKAAMLINNIVYSKTDKTYDDSIFTINNFKGSLAKNILEVKKHVHDYVKTDSDIERKFASDLECEEVLVYAKLPGGFKIPTPLGNYNPDWAIVFNTDKFKYVYFIAETKGSMETLQLKEIEQKKISYAKKHFIALGHADIKYDVIDSYGALRDKIMN
ncbi:MAG: DEAD/DEAH box helicase family protein [Deltaproteobacteria bacterium]|uniref:type III restriction-modification system endonuclease n=1 Tax=Desulfobacula sp. TaxID=2593537 RepID=UPI0019C32FF5|nr:DEAD/DEAH box helicase family protein [Candidatus Desulfobacula maris]MBL6995090.1 DEAD/DEAH box helicase family protein [Desulfobacula sp.]